MSVNAIRKQSTDEEVTSLAKSLIKSWKKLLGNYCFLLLFYNYLMCLNVDLFLRTVSNALLLKMTRIPSTVCSVICVLT